LTGHVSKERPAAGLTSLVFFKLDVVLEIQLVCIHFGIEAVVLLEHAGQTSGSGVD
jgi:hypothetical protein